MQLLLNHYDRLGQSLSTSSACELQAKMSATITIASAWLQHIGALKGYQREVYAALSFILSSFSLFLRIDNSSMVEWKVTQTSAQHQGIVTNPKPY